MKFKLIRSGLIAALLALPVAAQAADLSTPSYKAPSYVAPSYATWSGFYVGLNAGYGFGTSRWDVPAMSISTSGFVAGLTLGYNFQTGSWVWGVEGDADWSQIRGRAPCGTGTCEVRNDWLATARARLGYGGFGSFLPYITGGVAGGSVRASNTNFLSATKTQIGYVIGAGVEYALLTNFSVKLEYLYADLGKFNCGDNCAGAGTAPNNVTFSTSLIRGGVNYRF